MEYRDLVKPIRISIGQPTTEKLQAALFGFYFGKILEIIGGAGWSSPVARQAHNLKVVGSNPTPATNLTCDC